MLPCPRMKDLQTKRDEAGLEFRAEGIDHVELFVPSRRTAADWYERVLGLSVMTEMDHWAEDPTGPLMISSDDGHTKLALFRGEPQGDRKTAGFHRVAFRAGSSGFLTFLDRLPTLNLLDHRGIPVFREAIVDHDRSWSLYFVDPWGHRLELTTYDHGSIAARHSSLHSV